MLKPLQLIAKIVVTTPRNRTNNYDVIYLISMWILVLKWRFQKLGVINW
jgi:hypothetical protein